MKNREFLDEFITILQNISESLEEIKETEALEGEAYREGNYTAISIAKDHIAERIVSLRFFIEIDEDSDETDGILYSYDEFETLCRMLTIDKEDEEWLEKAPSGFYRGYTQTLHTIMSKILAIRIAYPEEIACFICGTKYRGRWFDRCPRCKWAFTYVENLYKDGEIDPHNLCTVESAKEKRAEGLDVQGNRLENS